jgi:GTP cyclohydrolase II
MFSISTDEPRAWESEVTLCAKADLPTEYGPYTLFGFRAADGKEAIALRYASREWNRRDTPLVRIHSQCLTGDVLGSHRCDCGPQLRVALTQISSNRCGMIVYEFDEGRGIGLLNKIRAYSLQDIGFDTISANEAIGQPADARDYRLAVSIFKHFGLRRVMLLTNNPAKVKAIAEAGIHVERIPLIVPVAEAARRYIRTKRDRMGHWYEPRTF